MLINSTSKDSMTANETILMKLGLNYYSRIFLELNLNAKNYSDDTIAAGMELQEYIKTHPILPDTGMVYNPVIVPVIADNPQHIAFVRDYLTNVAVFELCTRTVDRAT